MYAYLRDLGLVNDLNQSDISTALGRYELLKQYYDALVENYYSLTEAPYDPIAFLTGEYNNDLRPTWRSDDVSGVISRLGKEVEKYKKYVDEYNSAVQSVWENEAVIEIANRAKSNTFDQSYFDTYKNEIQTSTEYSDEYKAVLLSLLDDTFPQFAQKQNDTTGAVVVFNNTISKTKALLSSLGGVEGGFDLLSKIYEDITNGETFDYSSLISDDFVEKFGNLGEAYDSFIETVSKSPSDIKACQSAFNNLTTEYIKHSGVLENVTDDTRDLAVAWLKQIGVANAEIIVDKKLEIARLGVSKQKIQTSNDVDNLLSLAKSAGIAATALTKLTEAKDHFAKAEQYQNQAKSATDPRGGSALSSFARQEIEVAKRLVDSFYDSPDIDFSNVLSGSTTGTSKAVDAYVADVDKYYAATKRLEKVQLERAATEKVLQNETDPRSKISLERSMISLYAEEASAEQNLMSLKKNSIDENIQSLRNLGFVIDYNSETNELFIHNQEHINDLAATSAGKFNTLQEATNDLRKSTESLISDTEALNNENIEAAERVEELSYSIKASNGNIVSDIGDIAAAAKDSLDEVLNVYSSLESAVDSFNENGILTAETFNSILGLGTQYLQYLYDENGAINFNKDSLKELIKAKIEDLAVTKAMSLVDTIREYKDNAEELKKLSDATYSTADATWELVYANLAAIGLDDNLTATFTHQIEMIRSLAEAAKDGVNNGDGLSGSLSSTKESLDKIIDLTMELIRYEKEQEIQNLNDEIDAYKKIIDLKKESLDKTKEEENHSKTLAEKASEIAKLQSKINQLSLDDSREATAQRISLEEELSKLQGELTDHQVDYSVDKQKEMLDSMSDDYEEEKQKEIDAAESSISSTEKLYQLAIDRISGDWDNLYDALIGWNYNVGSSIQDYIVSAWNDAKNAAEKYGSFVSAMDAVSSTGNDKALADSRIAIVVRNMKANSKAWWDAESIVDPAQRKSVQDKLSDENMVLKKQLEEIYGLNLVRGADGVWYIDSVGGAKLYEKYHTGGIVGDRPTLEQDEMMTILQNGEAVLNKAQESSLYRIIDFTKVLSDRLGKTVNTDLFGNLISSGLGIKRYAVSGISPAFVGAGATGFTANISVNINHNGSMSDSDARRYGSSIANVAIEGLKDAFNKKGVNTITGSILK